MDETSVSDLSFASNLLCIPETIEIREQVQLNTYGSHDDHQSLQKVHQEKLSLFCKELFGNDV